MKSLTLRVIVALGLGALLLACGGCSRVTIAYNTADFFIEGYAKDYLELDDPQVASWKPELESALANHRREDLPYLARFFDTALKGAQQGFDGPRMLCLTDQFEELYRRHLGVAVGLAAPLLAALTPDQIRRLEEKFREEEAEDAADLYQPDASRQNRKRAERYRESIEWWIGPMSNAQEVIVREQTAAMPDTAANWIAYRNAKRDALIELLNRGAGEAEIHRYLETWLVEHRELPVSLRKTRGRIRDRIAELFIRMDESFSRAQRDRFADRLATMRDDFMSLQRHPRMGSVSCAKSH